MEIKVLGCSGGKTPAHNLTSYLVDEVILIDTGAAAESLPLELQETISDVLITHSHLDHILGLALMLDNTRASRVRPLEVYAAEATLRVIQDHLLSPEVMPFRFPGEGESPLINFHTIALETPFLVGGYEVEAFPVFHMAGAVAYRVSDQDHTMMFTGDTGRTDRIWNWIKARGGVDCLIAEASFPNRMDQLAAISRHLTPATLAASVAKADWRAEQVVHVVHLKPPFFEDMVKELGEQSGVTFKPLSRGDIIRMEKGRPEPVVVQAELEDRVRDKVPEFDREDDLYHQRDRLVKDFGVSVKAGSPIFEQGDKSKIMYIIQEGKVRIFRKAGGQEKTLATIGPGDFFGEMAMLNNRTRSASAVAVTNLKLLAFDRGAFEDLIISNFGVALHLIRTLAIRLQEADAIIENMLYIDPHSKVINALIQCSLDEGIETSEGYLVRTTPEKIADKSGVVIKTLRQILTDLVNDKMIVLRREAVIVPDLAKLKRLLTFLELKDEFTA
jgi:CRP-like cAMP-binding protein/ribonuclease BN (tRNA processing enzyme)